MDVDDRSPRFHAALRDFKRARQRGALESIIAYLKGEPDELWSYEEVSQQLRTGEPVDRGLQQIPLDAIVGSVGRYGDFTRTFLPRREDAQERWASVRSAFDSVEDIPPILVYKVGDSYFVLDGNHRVSVARVLGASHIAAYVTEVETKVSLSPDDRPDGLICQAQYAAFLEETSLDKLRPDADFTVTAPGQYRVLKEQIRRHRELLRQQRDEDVPYAAAVADWYDSVYLPTVRVIRRRGILYHFPGRTETDLYTWLMRHQEELKDELGWEVEADSLASNLVHRFSREPEHVLARVKERVLNAITPEPLEAGPPPGWWREWEVSERVEPYLFPNILVPLSGDASGWRALGQALIIARREEARLHGLHVITADEAALHQGGEVLRAEFQERLEQVGASGDFAVEVGRVAQTICDRARWNDLVVMALDYPPAPEMADRLTSGLSTLLRRCSRPVLAVPGDPTRLQRPLLAYDGSPKAKEALFVATYLAARWELQLTVVAVDEAQRQADDVLEHARLYLIARGVSADYVAGEGEAVDVIHDTAEAHDCDFVVMGGYGFRPLLEVVLGSTVDQVLRWRRWPVLICR